MPPIHEADAREVGATAEPSRAGSAGPADGSMATAGVEGEEDALKLVSVAFRTTGRRKMHISCRDKTARFIGGHARSPEQQGAQYQAVCCCPDCLKLPLAPASSGGRVMSLEEFSEHSGGSSTDWATSITVHWKAKSAEGWQSSPFRAWQIESSSATAAARLTSKAKTFCYWPEDGQWHSMMLQTLDQSTGLCTATCKEVSEPMEIALACELLADRPRPSATDLKMDLFLEIPSDRVPATKHQPSQPVRAQPALPVRPAAVSPDLPHVNYLKIPENPDLEGTSDGPKTPKCRAAECARGAERRSADTPRPKSSGSASRSQAGSLTGSQRGTIRSQGQARVRKPATRESNTSFVSCPSDQNTEEARRKKAELSTLWRSNLTSFAENSSPAGSTIFSRNKWCILACAAVLLLIFAGAAVWWTFAYHDNQVASLATEQEALLLEFRELMTSQFVSKAKAMYRLSLQTQDFFETPDGPLLWASASECLSQLREVNTSGVEIMRIDLIPGSTWVTVPPENLQDKSSRFYTEASLELAASSMYISPVDLNMEFGALETPYKLVYRMSAPVFDAGARQGFVIGNYLAKGLWREWGTKLPESYTVYWDVLNTNLHFLASSHLGDSVLYGMSLPSRANLTYDGDLLEDVQAALAAGGGMVNPRVTGPKGCLKGAVALPYSSLTASMSGVDLVEDGDGFVLLLTVPGDQLWADVANDLRGFYLAMAAGYIALCAITACVYFFWNHTAMKAKQNEESHQFLASVSHDLRSPLHVMSNALQLLHSEEMADKYEFRALQAAVESMLSLLSNTVYLYRDGLDTHVPPQKRSLGEDLVTLTEITAFLANEKDLYLHLELPENLPAVLLVNWNGLKQVLVNLLSNAIKFTVRGGIVIHVRAENAENHQVCLTLSVSDTGPGLPILSDGSVKPGSKRNKSDKRGEPAGLGLSICDRIIRSMACNMEVASVQGQGCTFTISGLMCDVVDPPEEAPSWGRLTDQCQDRARPLRFVAILDQSDSQRVLPRLQRLVGKLSKMQYPVVLDIVHGESLEGNVAPLHPNCVVWVGYYVFQAEGLLNSLVEQVQASNSRLVILSYVCGSFSVKDAPSVLSDNFPHTFAYPPWTPERLATALLKSATGPVKTAGFASSDQAKEQDSMYSDLKVLVVDDMSVNRTIARRIFSKNFGLAIDEAAGGKECLKILEASGSRWYDVVLMDLQMPEMDGIECVIEIRKMEHRLRVRSCTAVGLSASVLAKDRIACLGAGMDDYFTKPMSVPQFRKLLKGVVSKKQAIASTTENGADSFNISSGEESVTTGSLMG